MAKSMKLSVGGKNFASRTEARAHLRNIRARWDGRGPLVGPDHDFVLAVFSHHPASKEKAGPGVHQFVVGPGVAPDGRAYNKCFHVVSLDGTTVDFSTDKALKGAYAAS